MSTFKHNGNIEVTDGNITIDGQPIGGGGIEGTNYIYIQANGTDLENGEELGTAYLNAEDLEPSPENIITIILGPGYYNLAREFVVDVEYINIVTLDGNRSVIFNGETINVIANNVHIKGINVLNKQFKVGNNDDIMENTIIENCEGGTGSFCGVLEDDVEIQENMFIAENPVDEIRSTFINCKGGDYSFATATIGAGEYYNCEGGIASFSSMEPASSNGKYFNCKGGDFSFGAGGGFANGHYELCTGDINSFGTLIGEDGESTLNGKLYRCRLTEGDFISTSETGVIILGINGNDNIVNDN